MRFNHHALATISALLAPTANACPYLKGRNKDNDYDGSQAKRALRPEYSFPEGFTYGRLFPDLSKLEVPAAELYSATVGDDAYTNALTRAGADPGRQFTTFLKDEEGEFTGVQLSGLDIAGLAGYTYLAQLLSHEVNHQVTTEIGASVIAEDVPNCSTPYTDLDTMYGHCGKPALMNDDGHKFMMSSSFDFMRYPDGTAKITDDRNDNSKILSQITSVFMNLHNTLYDHYMRLHGCGVFNNYFCFFEEYVKQCAFDYAKGETQRHWMSVILHDLLPAILDKSVLEEVTARDYEFKLYTGDVKEKKQLPMEFNWALRVLHSRVATGYRMNAKSVFVPLLPASNVNDDSLMGGRATVFSEKADWGCWFDSTPNSCGAGTDSPRNANTAHTIDQLTNLGSLPVGFPGNHEEVAKVIIDGEENPLGGTLDDGYETTSLDAHDGVRALDFGLSGGVMAAAYAISHLHLNIGMYTCEDLENSVFRLPEGWCDSHDDDVPLMWYLSHEAWEESGGKHMGRFGSYIVAETIVSLVRSTESYSDYWLSPITWGREVTFLDLTKFIGWDWTSRV